MHFLATFRDYFNITNRTVKDMYKQGLSGEIVLSVFRKLNHDNQVVSAFMESINGTEWQIAAQVLRLKSQDITDTIYDLMSEIYDSESLRSFIHTQMDQRVIEKKEQNQQTEIQAEIDKLQKLVTRTKLTIKKKKLVLSQSKSKASQEKEKVKKWIGIFEQKLQTYLGLIEKLQIQFNNIVDGQKKRDQCNLMKYLQLRGYQGEYEGKKLCLIPSNENVFFISDRVETLPISDFLAGLNKRESYQKKLHDRIKRKQALIEAGTDLKNQLTVYSESLQLRSCRQQSVESVFDWNKQPKLYAQFKSLTSQVNLPRLTEAKIKRWLKTNVIEQQQTDRKAVNKSTKSSNSHSSDEYETSEESDNYLK